LQDARTVLRGGGEGNLTSLPDSPFVFLPTGGNQLRAAQLLGITRRTLRHKLRDLGLSITKAVEASEGDNID
jgi:hypothetical protein